MKKINKLYNKKFFALLTIVSLINTGCFKKSNLIKEEGADVREAMESTVKIRTKVTGHKRFLFSSEEETKKLAEKQEEETYSGTGAVIKNDLSRNESLILSVAHVTNPDQVELRTTPIGFYFFIIDKVELSIEKLDGSVCEAASVISNSKKDISVIRSKCIAGTVAEIAKELPPVGSNIIISGAALGFHPPNIFIVVDGRYMGIDNDSGEEITTAAVAGGHSGSGVFYRGKIVGILTKRTIKYEHISFCVSLENIKDIISDGEAIWKLSNNL